MRLVAIGGGIYYRDGEWTCTFIDILKEIVRLSGKNNPNVLIVCHAAELYDDEIIECVILQNIFESIGCNIRILLRSYLDDMARCDDYLKWSDIVYVDGGNTIKMLELWNKTGFRKVLLNNQDKIYSGLSAGANCWFRAFNSQQKYDFVSETGLGLVDAYCVPHAEDKRRKFSAYQYLKNINITGLYIPSDTGIEILDDKYRVIRSSNAYMIMPTYGYYNNGEFVMGELDNTSNYFELSKVLKRKCSR